MEPLNENDELKRSAPTLFGLPKTDPFVVPDGLFERFPHEVQARIVDRKDTPPAWIWWKRMVIALPVVALVAGGIWWSQQTKPVENALAETQLAPLTDAELDDMDDNDLFALTEGADAQEAPPELGNVDVNLNDNELLAYLENENADLDELITETE
ncbi:MAG: hypothetical protein IPP33_08220 [Flavobacteriales bacterium]|nr:hypothetical protein [Flavobacteriales bacterium]